MARPKTQFKLKPKSFKYAEDSKSVLMIIEEQNADYTTALSEVDTQEEQSMLLNPHFSKQEESEAVWEIELKRQELAKLPEKFNKKDFSKVLAILLIGGGLAGLVNQATSGLGASHKITPFQVLFFRGVVSLFSGIPRIALSNDNLTIDKQKVTDTCVYSMLSGLAVAFEIMALFYCQGNVAQSILCVAPLFYFALSSFTRKHWRKDVGPFDFMMFVLVMIVVSLVLRPKELLFSELRNSLAFLKSVKNPTVIERVGVLLGLASALLFGVSFFMMQKIKQNVQSGTLATAQGFVCAFIGYFLVKHDSIHEQKALTPETLILVAFYALLSWVAQEISIKGMQVDLGKHGFFVQEFGKWAIFMFFNAFIINVLPCPQGTLAAMMIGTMLAMYSLISLATAYNKSSNGGILRRGFKDEQDGFSDELQL